jgi:hypothetical protein
MKAVLKGKLIALSAAKKKKKKKKKRNQKNKKKQKPNKQTNKQKLEYTSSLTAHLKALEQKEANSPRGVDSRK